MTELNIKPVAWSSSRLDDFDTCLYRGYRKHVTKDVTYGPQSVSQKRGNDDHEALQASVQYGTKLPAHLAMCEQAVKSFRQEAAQGNFVVAEYERAITKELKSTGWFDADAWGRSKMDIFIHRDKWMPPHAKAPIYIRDWKSGKPRNDWMVLASRYAVFAFILYPTVDDVHVEVDYYNHGEVKGTVFQRSGLSSMAAPIFKTLQKVRDAQISGDWPTTKTGLCRGYCPVEDCAHWEPLS